MSTTLFLAQLWGPAIMAVALGIFFNRQYYVKTYRDLQKEPLAMLVFGMTAISAAIAHIHVHNVWSTLPEAIISFLGWALLCKGFALTIFPKTVDAVADYEAKSHLVPVAGGLSFVLGAYLTYVAFFG